MRTKALHKGSVKSREDFKAEMLKDNSHNKTEGFSSREHE